MSVFSHVSTNWEISKTHWSRMQPLRLVNSGENHRPTISLLIMLPTISYAPSYTRPIQSVCIVARLAIPDVLGELHVDWSLIWKSYILFNGSLSAECAVRPPSNKMAEIPEDVPVRFEYVILWSLIATKSTRICWCLQAHPKCRFH